ncbi:MAG: AMP-binding protein [Polyangiaceae bacterium]|nr:AMP-binding protein [Polyangiaceae bacterium]
MTATLDVGAALRGRRIVVVGGTGFLGKVWLSMLLRHYPEIERVHLVVRSKKGADSEARFWADVAPSPTFDPVREAHPGAAFEALLREKVRCLDADVSKHNCGLSDATLAALRGQVDAVVNVAGVVDFNPPLDEALLANAFGVQNLVSLARALGDVPVLHTSTCYVAGYRDGLIDERNPLDHPFPKHGELEAVHWEPAREIAECLDLVAQARHRQGDAFRESAFLAEARATLERRGEPTRGAALEDELAKVRRKFLEQRLIDAGGERARYWGFTNIYTYTKSIGEQILAQAGRDAERPLPFCIVRPSVIESSVAYPFPSWTEGINTMAPLIYLALNGHIQVPTSARTTLDVIPVDMVAGGMILSLAALLEGTAPEGLHLSSSDVAPYPMHRLIELTGLYKRRHQLASAKGNWLKNQVLAHIEPVPVTTEQFYRHGAPAIASLAKGVAGALRGANLGPAAGLARAAAKALDGYSSLARRNGEIWEMYIPFMAETEYVFSAENIRGLRARLSDVDRERLNFRPEILDWRWYMHDVQLPALEKWVWPEIDEKVNKPTKPLRAHDHLLAMLDDVAERYDLMPALLQQGPDGFTRVSYREAHERATATAARLHERGVRPGDRVMLAGANGPAWPIAYFGILRAGAIAVPVDPALDAARLSNLARASRAKGALFDRALREGEGAGLEAPVWDLDEATEAWPGAVAPSVPAPTGDTVASILYTSGTTGTPKGVTLTHGNFVALIGSLGPLFPLSSRDRTLSVLPLHHAFEFTCGLLLPFSRGARVVYLDHLDGERLGAALREARVTAMVGVPALWQLLERRIVAEVEQKGPLAASAFEALLRANRLLGANVGVDLGRVFFGAVHGALGGELRVLISGGAALPKDTAKLFAGLGLHLAEGYGLTEASPVLTVAQASPRAKPGHVGKAIPGVDVKLHEPDKDGVGEVLARGPNVMVGYEGDEDATRAVMLDGWLRTGDLGRFDRAGKLTIVGRAKDVIVSANGENVDPDDLEAMLGAPRHVHELSIVGIADARGGERVALVAVPSRPVDGEPDDARARRSQATLSLREAVAKLPPALRPALTLIVDAELPRTATRKVKRPLVRQLAERLAAASVAPPSSPGQHRKSAVRAAVASLSRRDPSEIHGATTLRADLGFDSLMLMELSAALEAALDGVHVADALAASETVGELEAALEAADASTLAPPPERAPLSLPDLPEPVRERAKDAIAWLQRGFYASALRPRVTGRAFIPHNRNVLVVANHASHLDMGLVKHALGSYGADLVALAARDYFFEKDPVVKALVENFTNLAPLDRNAGLRETLRDVGRLLEAGKTVLIFPEGTRSPDGQIREFKGAVGHLALRYGVDVLPVWVGGTYEAMPRDRLVPTRRDVTARIGPVLASRELSRMTAGYKPAAAARAAARLTQRAVEALRDGGALDLSRMDPGELDDAPRVHPLVQLMGELPSRFVRGAVGAPVSFYFTLGAEDEAKWTVRVAPDKVDVVVGKPAGGVADCVLKTTPEMFTRIVREGYTPGPPEFLSGVVKSNDVGLLVTFQKAFQLG